MNIFNRNIIKQAVKAVAMATCLIFSGCRSEEPFVPANEVGEDGSVTITCSVTIPGMSDVATRGAFAATPGENLKLTVYEFTAANTAVSAAGWNLKNIYQAETKSATNVQNGQTVTFDLTLLLTPNSNQPTKLHLMVADDFIVTGYGSEATLFPDITVSNGAEAYWGEVLFDKGVAKSVTDAEGNTSLELLTDVTQKLQNVPVIRNFASITVTDAEAAGDDHFELLGFGIIHTPDQGTVAPLHSDLESPYVPALLNGSAMKSYADISKIYQGITPVSSSFSNTEPEARGWTYAGNQDKINTEVKYLYEHPYESTRRTYLIIYGNYRSSAGATPQAGYYKVDIGNLNPTTHLFEYYNIIRNINYNVKINTVRAPGTATVAEAIDRAPFNNLMAATETSSMLNVSNGQNMLIINDANHVIVTKDQKIDILYRYIKDVTGTQTPANDVPSFICEAPGPVVKSYEQMTDSVDKGGTRWVRYQITPNEPTDEVKTQDISIVDPDGLGRVIHLVLRKPWQYAPLYAGASTCITVDNGTGNMYEFDEESAKPDVISNGPGYALTVYFNLPNGLPESMFPLVFRIEAEKQGIENNKIGNLVVYTGSSLFDPKKISISYLKTVSYAEYLYQYEDANTITVNVSKPNTNHTVRARFTTISSVEAGSTGNFRVHNPYFDPDINVVFTRAVVSD